MKPAASAATSEPSSADRLSGLGAFIWHRRARVLAAAGRAGGERVVECRLRGGSMAQAIPARSRIRISLAAGPYRVGDVVAFMIDARVVVHRIVHLRRRSASASPLLITRGDAMIVPDPPIDAADVLGRVDEIDAGSGWRAPGACTRAPHRERLLAFVLLVATALVLQCSAERARRFAAWLAATEQRVEWTKTLLY